MSKAFYNTFTETRFPLWTLLAGTVDMASLLTFQPADHPLTVISMLQFTNQVKSLASNVYV